MEQTNYQYYLEQLVELHHYVVVFLIVLSTLIAFPLFVFYQFGGLCCGLALDHIFENVSSSLP